MPPPLAVAALVKPLSSFISLSRNVRLYEPSSASASDSPTAPTTILFCSWMNASPKHVQYYVKRYMNLFPHARIILVTITTSQFVVDSEAKRRADVQEAVTALLARPQEHERLLVHMLSNGGGKRLYGIAAVYRDITGIPLPAKAIIVDSAPGIPHFRRDVHALSIPAKKLNWLLWVPYILTVLLIASATFVCTRWLPRWVWRELVWGPTEGLVSAELVDRKAVRGFIYSKEDLAICYKDVETFIKATAENGCKVVIKKVEGAGHVQLFRGNGGEKDYWRFIEKAWGVNAGIETVT